MTTRDRLVLMGVVAAGILAAVWFLLIVPERKQATSLNEQVAVARQTLTVAQAKLNGAKTAQSQYDTAYTSIVRLGEAVPPTDQVPSLVYELDQLSNSKHVEFASITSSGGSGPSASSTSTSTSSTAAASSTGGGFRQLPFTFTFNGSFFDLSNLLHQLDGLAVQTSGGGVRISGRLLTIQSVDLAGSSEGSSSEESSSSSSKNKEPHLTGTVTATAYVLPSGQSLTGGATSAGPAGVASTTAVPASTSSTSAPSTPAAVTEVTP